MTNFLFFQHVIEALKNMYQSNDESWITLMYLDYTNNYITMQTYASTIRESSLFDELRNEDIFSYLFESTIMDILSAFITVSKIQCTKNYSTIGHIIIGQ